MTDAATLHRDAIVVDTHNDLILLVDHHAQRDRRAHFADFWLPQLRDGGVDVQVLPVFIEPQFMPEGALRRTLLLIERIHQLADEHADEVAICVTATQIDAAVAGGKIALVIALEGAPALGDDVALLRTLHRCGVRVLSFTHMGRSQLADGSALDTTSSSRLTQTGIAALAEMERLGIVMDISHLGAAGIEHVLELATRPLIGTHNGVRAVQEHHRNLTDDQIRGIAALGGVIGVAVAIPFFIDPQRPTVDRAIDHIDHVVELVGVEHVGIGPDFIRDYFMTTHGEFPALDGVEAKQEDISRPADLPKLTAGLLERGYSEADIHAILGGNFLRVFRAVLR